MVSVFESVRSAGMRSLTFSPILAGIYSRTAHLFIFEGLSESSHSPYLTCVVLHLAPFFVVLFPEHLTKQKMNNFKHVEELRTIGIDA